MNICRSILTGILALILFIGGIIAVALITEHQAGATPVSPLVRLADVERALRGRGLEVSPTGRVVTDPRLGVPGYVLEVDGVQVVVYLFPSVAERVDADQKLTIQRALSEAEARLEVAAPRFVTARNALLIYTTDDSRLSSRIYHAAVDLSRT